MPNYHYPNLTIINETDLHSKNSNVFDNAVIASLPLSATDAIGHQSIRDAIQQQFQLDMQVEDVSKLCFLHCTWIYQDYHACHHYMLLSPPWSNLGSFNLACNGAFHPLGVAVGQGGSHGRASRWDKARAWKWGIRLFLTWKWVRPPSIRTSKLYHYRSYKGLTACDERKELLDPG